MPVRIALIGADDAARVVAQTLSSLDEARIVAVCAQSKNADDFAQAETLARRLRALAFRDVRAILSDAKTSPNTTKSAARDETPDAFCIVVGGRARRDAIALALGNGLDLFLAPPLPTSRESAQTLLKDVGQARARLWIAHGERFGESAENARKLLHSRGNAPLCVFGSWTLKGSFHQSSTRLVGLLRFLNGEISGVFALSSADVWSLNCDFANGAVGAFVIGGNCENLLCFQGKNQRVEWREAALTLRRGRETQQIEYSNDASKRELRAWLESVQSGRRTLAKSNAPDALQTLRVALAVQQSAKTNKPVRLA